MRTSIGLRTFLTAIVIPLLTLQGCASAHPIMGPVKVDGTIVSMKLLSYPGGNPNINIYDMVYWSQGQKAEAYVTEPKNPGPYEYPLSVSCHGGYSIPEHKSHVPSPQTLSSVAQSLSNTVVVFPQYQGYAGSDGYVKGILGETLDTENAIKAADSLSLVNPQDGLDLYGTSLGGGVALMVASSPEYSSLTNRVIATSPFVGWHISGMWYEQNADYIPAVQRALELAQMVYGPYSATAASYIRRSPNIANISCPVLLLQGTKDYNVPWQTVEEFYRDMKQDGKRVTLDLIPGGNHGLTGPFQPIASKDITTWLATLPK